MSTATHNGQVTAAAIRCADRAERNLAKWGLQGLLTLIAASAEELGECAQEVLEEQRCGGHLDRVAEEAKDLGALCLQMMVAAKEGMAAVGPAGQAYAVPADWRQDGPAREAGRPVPWFANGGRLARLAWELAESAKAAADPARERVAPAAGMPQEDRWLAQGQAAGKIVRDTLTRHPMRG